MPRKKWFIDLETKAQMNTNAIGIIEEIMGELHTTAEEKVVEIAQTLQSLTQAWNMKKAPTAMEAPKETIQPQCTIDISKVESLVDMPHGGPGCLKCDCFKCKNLPSCHIMFPTTLYHCGNRCGGFRGVTNCGYRSES